MKKTILLLLLSYALFVSAQPKLVGTLGYSGLKEGGGIFRIDLPGSTPGIIHVFDNFSPHRPSSGVTAGDANWLYGMLFFNGVNRNGGLYKIKQDGTGFTMLYNLDYSGGAATTPYYHTDGMIYFNNEFQFKKLDPATNIITGFDLNAGVYARNLVIDVNDWIYFLTGASTVAKIKTDGTGWTDLHSFNSATEGSNGVAGLTEIPGDSLFGVQTSGGTFDGGTIFSIKKDGSAFAVHHQFSTATGIYPESRLVYFDGKLFGTTSQGGDFGLGVLYSIMPDGTGYRVLRSFEPGSIAITASPLGNISITSNGRIFGSFSQYYYDGFNYYRLFKVDTSGQNFQPFIFLDQREQGSPDKDILLLNDETILIATAELGRHDGGALNVSDTSGALTNLYQFGYSANGFRPVNIMKASDDKLYGTTTIGGTSGNGVLFSMNASGTGYTVLHQFTDAEGYLPSGKLLEASDGKLYGALRSGGPYGTGGLFHIDKNGSNFTLIFSPSDLTQGYSPVGGLVEDNSGILYGANFSGSSSGAGTLFKINKNGGSYTVIKYFNAVNDLGYLYNGLVFSKGFLYGAASAGGTENKGGIFRIKTDGSSYQVLHEFAGATDGAQPAMTPVITQYGMIYGTTASGGNNNNGTIFRIDSTGGNYSILRHFLQSTDGAYPWAGLIQASDGLIYAGTNYGSGFTSGGNLVKMNLDGSGFVVVRSFDLDTEGQGINSLMDLNGGSTLPVQLFTFSAQKAGQTVLLNWKTAQEQNSERFGIERSSDGNAFVAIGSLPAHGDTHTISSYSFTDVQPLKGMNFYRLKELDKDGGFLYSKVVSVYFDKLQKLFISPNPATDLLHIQLLQGNHYDAIAIHDASGRLVLQKLISNSSTTVSLDIRHLAGGWYSLKLSGKENWRGSFIKK